MNGVLAQAVNDNQTLLLAGAGSVISLLFWLYVNSIKAEKERALSEKDKALKQVEESNQSYREIAEEAIGQLRTELNKTRRREGKDDLPNLAAVIPESHSPSTKSQRLTADISTKRAEMAAIKLESGEPPRPEPEWANEGTP